MVSAPASTPRTCPDGQRVGINGDERDHAHRAVEKQRLQRQILLDDVSQRASHGVSFFLSGSLNHDAHKRLRARGTQEHTSRLTKTRLSSSHSISYSLVRGSSATIDAANINEGLRQSLDERREISQ